MRCPVFCMLLLGQVLILLTTGGCSNVNVKASDDSIPPHEKTFREEMEGRTADYQRPVLIEAPLPEYTAEAAALDLSGLVMIKVLVGYDGQVAEAEVVQGLHPLVDAAALEAARAGRYAPATESGVATEGSVTVPFRYPPGE